MQIWKFSYPLLLSHTKWPVWLRPLYIVSHKQEALLSSPCTTSFMNSPLSCLWISQRLETVNHILHYHQVHSRRWILGMFEKLLACDNWINSFLAHQQIFTSRVDISTTKGFDFKFGKQFGKRQHVAWKVKNDAKMGWWLRSLTRYSSMRVLTEIY